MACCKSRCNNGFSQTLPGWNRLTLGCWSLPLRLSNNLYQLIDLFLNWCQYDCIAAAVSFRKGKLCALESKSTRKFGIYLIELSEKECHWHWVNTNSWKSLGLRAGAAAYWTRALFTDLQDRSPKWQNEMEGNDTVLPVSLIPFRFPLHCLTFAMLLSRSNFKLNDCKVSSATNPLSSQPKLAEGTEHQHAKSPWLQSQADRQAGEITPDIGQSLTTPSCLLVHWNMQILIIPCPVMWFVVCACVIIIAISGMCKFRIVMSGCSCLRVSNSTLSSGMQVS